VSPSAPAPTPPAGAASAPVGAAASGPLVVAIVVDQLAAWVASERLPLLPRDGGFARLLREGTYVRDMRYAHAVTDTAPGHAALFTGAVPRASGVWANELPDAAAHGKVSIVLDKSTKLISAVATDYTGSSARLLKTETVADRFRAAHGDALIVSLSIKDRGAIFGGGKTPTATIWYDRPHDAFVTSTAFAQSFPAWAIPLDVPNAVRAKPWTPLDEAWVRTHAATPDAEEGEGKLDGKSITFPHDAAHAEVPSKAFIGSPAADKALLDLALAALDANRTASGVRLLSISLSANDYIGHAYGPDSWEAWDELRQLDSSLGRFFAALDARFGANGWSVVLSGDHGIVTMPEAALQVPASRPWCKQGDTDDKWHRPCGAGGRLFNKELATELEKVAEATFKKPDLVAGVVDPYVYLSNDARGLPAKDKMKLLAALTVALKKHPEIDRVVDTSALPATCPPDSDESVDALTCRSFVPGSAGDLYMLVKPGSFFDADVVVGKGTSHGTPYLYDRSVPLLVRAPGHAVAGKVVEEPISFRAYARALATLLGVEPPDSEAARAIDLAKAP
jgi:hypothetical protein